MNCRPPIVGGSAGVLPKHVIGVIGWRDRHSAAFPQPFAIPIRRKGSDAWPIERLLKTGVLKRFGFDEGAIIEVGDGHAITSVGFGDITPVGDARSFRWGRPSRNVGVGP